MSGRPLRVFLSHTSEFREHPAGGSYIEAAERAVIAAGHAVTDMKYFVAREQSPAAYCEEQVRAADVYVGVIGLRYGSAVRDRPGACYTELEFETAVAADIPTLLFLLDEDRENRLPPRALQYDPRQRAFRGRLKDHATAAAFGTPDELALAVERALRDLAKRRTIPPSSVPPRTHAIVPRPEQFAAILDGVLAGGVVGVTALHGGGGFGKTTLAAEVCRDPRVREHFRGGILWVTIGEHLVGPELAAKVNDLSEQLSGEKPTFTDPEQAGQHFGGLLGPRQLLVVDDVWTAGQLRPFLAGGDGCTRLVTTRVRGSLPDSVEPLTVPVMRPVEAVDLLRSDLPDVLFGDDIDAFLAATGGWPLLIRLVNRSLRGYLRHGADLGDAAARALRRLASGGPAALDIRRSDERSAAVEVTLEGSFALLGENLPRYLELAVFAEDATIPQPTLEHLWAHTGGLDTDNVEALCVELADLALVEDYRLGVGLRVHDVVHQYLRHRAGDALGALHRSLVDAHRSLAPEGHWWELPADEPYLLGTLAGHLHAAGDPGLGGLLLDLRWTLRRLNGGGPAAVEADLALGSGELHERLQRAIRQDAHLLGPLEPASALTATLLSRLWGDPDLQVLVDAYGPPEGTHLVPRWPLPDLPDPALVRAISAGVVAVLALLPDGRIAAADAFEGIRTWTTGGVAGDAVLAWDGGPQHPVAFGSGWLVAYGGGAYHAYPLDEHRDPVTFAAAEERETAAAVSPDGTWLATGSHRGIGLWATDGTPRGRLGGPGEDALAVAISPDGTWLAATGWCEGTVPVLRRWDADGRPPGDPFRGHTDAILCLAISPDGTWLASGGMDRTVRLWDASGAPAGVLTGHTGSVEHVAITPDGRHVVSAGADGTVRVWDPARAGSPALRAPRGVVAVGVSTDGRSVLAVYDEDDGLGLWSEEGSVDIDIGGSPRAIAVSPAGRAYAFVDASSRLSIVDVVEERASIRIEAHPTPDDLLLGDGPEAVIGCFDGGRITRWDRTGRERATFDSGLLMPAGVVLAPDESAIAVIGLFGVAVFGLDGDPLGATVAEDDLMDVAAVAFAPDASYLAVADAEGHVSIRCPDGTVLAGLDIPASTLSLSPDGRLIATFANDDVLRIWDRETGTCAAALRIGGSGNVIRWVPSGIVIGGAAGVYVLELRDWTPPDLHSQP